MVDYQTASPTSHDTAHGSSHSAMGHVVSLPLLAAVFIALLILTGATVAAAHVDLGNLNLYVALAIAVTKATLVVLFFMHLYWDRPFNAMVFIGCLLFVSLFIGVSLTDMRANERADVPGQGREMKAVHTPLGTEK